MAIHQGERPLVPYVAGQNTTERPRISRVAFIAIAGHHHQGVAENGINHLHRIAELDDHVQDLYH